MRVRRAFGVPRAVLVCGLFLVWCGPLSRRPMIGAKDVPSIQIIRSPVTKHTDDDKPEWVPAAGLEAVARAYARIIDDVNKLDRKDLLPAARTSTQAGAR
jgi:hypothetical protein